MNEFKLKILFEHQEEWIDLPIISRRGANLGKTIFEVAVNLPLGKHPKWMMIKLIENNPYFNNNTRKD